MISGKSDALILKQHQNKTLFVTGIPSVKRAAFDPELDIKWEGEQEVVSL